MMLVRSSPAGLCCIGQCGGSCLPSPVCLVLRDELPMKPLCMRPIKSNPLGCKEHPLLGAAPACWSAFSSLPVLLLNWGEPKKHVEHGKRLGFVWATLCSEGETREPVAGLCCVSVCAGVKCSPGLERTRGGELLRGVRTLTAPESLLVASVLRDSLWDSIYGMEMILCVCCRPWGLC